jgi:hypothetical protein
VLDLVEELRADDPFEVDVNGDCFEIFDESGEVVLNIPMSTVIGLIARRAYH